MAQISKVYSKPDTTKVFRQYDSRWGKLYYPDKNHTISSSGCACVSITHCALENNKYRNATPVDIYPFMKQYAKAGKGTLQDGIKKGLEKYEYTEVEKFDIKNSKDLTSFWNALKKGKKGVVLFRGVKRDATNVTPDGTIWTESGHYVSVVGFKIVGNKHYFYTKDSGRGHDGWWCFETSMKNSLYRAWLAIPPEDTVVLPKRGYFKVGDSGKDVEILQVWLNLNGFDCGEADGIYGKKTAAAVTAFEKKYKLKEDGLWGKNCQAKYESLEK